jgi:tRNA-2-methylthio-N6-dimethylallyladenosine synthase
MKNYGKKLMENNKSYYIETFGCEMNKSDSIDIALSFEERGYTKAESEIKADVIVLNTCAVRENAEERVLGRLGYYRAFKERYRPDAVIVLTGCMAQERGRELVNIFPEIDVVTGTCHIMEIPGYTEKVPGSAGPVIALDKNGYRFSEFRGKRAEGYKAWVNIITGCSNFCSYCVVPYLRGPERSKRSEDIIAEIKELAARGVAEITLLGQNVNSYGKDNNDISFIELLEKIDELDGIKWVRFLTSHPKDFNREMVKRIAGLEKVCRHFHLPVQSGSDRILKLMNRKYTVAHYMDIVEAINTYIPGSSITTDFIVGFPSESEEDYNQTLDLMMSVLFDDAFTYIYSERLFEKARDIPEKIPPEISKKRIETLIMLQRRISYEKNREEIGNRRNVLSIGESKRNREEMLCKTETGKMVVVNTKAPPGSFLDIEITGISGNTLRGEEIS